MSVIDRTSRNSELNTADSTAICTGEGPEESGFAPGLEVPVKSR